MKTCSGWRPCYYIQIFLRQWAFMHVHASGRRIHITASTALINLCFLTAFISSVLCGLVPTFEQNKTSEKVYHCSLSSLISWRLPSRRIKNWDLSRRSTDELAVCCPGFTSRDPSRVSRGG
ncbi:hypothetical protein H2248_012507 [Termitomyces sp. 'cryptogamus']|nr:hypothetical protein H2248_012507 [Termitomyces sp. 'cryptogamus']